MADIILHGNVGNVEMKFTQGGKALLSLSVAENHRKRDGNGWQDDGTTWWRVTVWERAAETLAEHLNKGDRVIVTGTVRSREFDGSDGTKRTAYDVTARHVGVIPKQGQPQSPAGGQQGDPWGQPATGQSFPEEAPF